MRAFVGWSVTTVTGPSMAPTLVHGDYLVVRRVSRRRPLSAGDVVVAEIPRRRTGLMVKRVSASVDGGWWLLSDNEFATSDSREFGAVAEDAIQARAILRIRDTPSWWRFWEVRVARVGRLGPPKGWGQGAAEA